MLQLTDKQQTIYDWLKKLQLPVYAEAYRGAVRALQEQSPGYGTFVSHTGRDIMNSLATTIVGMGSRQVHYKQLVGELEQKWPYQQQGDSIDPKIYSEIENLIEEHKDGRRRNQEASDLFFDICLNCPEKEKDSVKKKWKNVKDYFLKCAHLREADLTDETLELIAGNFEFLEEFLYTAAELEYSRIKILDKTIAEANKSAKLPKSKKRQQAARVLAERTLGILKGDVDRQYFFLRLKNPHWLQALADNGCFESPPSTVILPSGGIQYPLWGEFQYLENVCDKSPDEVVKLVLNLPTVDNPRVYEYIVDIALRLDGDQSGQLLPKILEYARLEHHFVPFELPKLLAYWTAEGQTTAALELVKHLVQFDSDPKSEEKNRKAGDDHGDSINDQIASMMTFLQPLPRFKDIYLDILNDGVRPLAEKKPFEVSEILIDAAATMIFYNIHQKDFESGEIYDYTETAWPRLNKLRNDDYPDSDESLVKMLTYASEKVFELTPVSIESLDTTLRKQKWRLFGRLRQHLYALHPNVQTLPWIRELVLAHPDYGKWEHHFEFQRMIRAACGKFGEGFLAKDERTQIFETILNGPSRDDFQSILGDNLTSAKFHQMQRQFHHVQLRPFVNVLFGKFATYFRELDMDESLSEITNETYSPVGKSTGEFVSFLSPKSADDLANLSDIELLDLINEWEDERWDLETGNTRIDIDTLAGTFQTVFKESIIPNRLRLSFWIENRDDILRPVYVRSMVNAMHDLVKEKDFDKLEKWLAFCRWVLDHPDPTNLGEVSPGRLGDGSREHPYWHTSRRAVCDLLGECFEDDIDLPLRVRAQFAEILHTICTQYDCYLDTDNRVISNGTNELNEGINSTRGKAIGNLVKFGFWVRKHKPKAKVTEIKGILESRFSADSKYPLTGPEYAILGMEYCNLLNLDKQWALSHKSSFFPHCALNFWRESFGNLLEWSPPHKLLFNELGDQFEFALEHQDCLKQQKRSGGKTANDSLGRHLFYYYVWGFSPLTGQGSQIEVFYQKTDGERMHWATLFGHIGNSLQNAGARLDVQLEERLFAFFEWRFQTGEPKELKQFVNWIEAECLDVEWRLESFSRILDQFHDQKVNLWKDQDISFSSFAIHSMSKLIPKHTSGVVKCLGKMVSSMPETGRPIIIDDAKDILQAGLNHDDKNVYKNALEIREDLLLKGYFSIMD